MIMDIVSVDFSQKKGAIKPMHCTNNGPVYKWASDQRITNLPYFQEAGIPYARVHDSSFYATYGGEHIVDVNMIFTNPDADPYDPASYDFDLTDDYFKVIELGGSKVFYRLGSKIEHWRKKYNTLPPKDFKKWAIVCEHIIRHYCYGWANGFNMDIQYWEIWNEADNTPEGSAHNPCWSGTDQQFYDLFRITLEHLKTTFPSLKIGGPSLTTINHEEWAQKLIDNLGDIKPDFFSWHVYNDRVEKMVEKMRMARAFLDKNGLTECESILNEWNYVKDWWGDAWEYSLKVDKSLKGAAFISATMLASQDEPLDMLMYYDARPGGMNGMFNTDCVRERLKGYYPFYMFNQLYKQKTQVSATVDGNNLYAVGASGEEQTVVITHYDDDDNAPAKQVKIEFTGVENEGKVKLEYYCLDEKNDCALVREEIFTANEFACYLTLPVYTTYLLKIVKL